MGVGRRAHQNTPGARARSSPRGWIRSVPVRSAGDGVAREGVELSGSIDGTWAPLEFFERREHVRTLARSGPGREVNDSIFRESPHAALSFHDPRAREVSLGRRRRRHPQGEGWAQRESAGSWRWVSPRDRAPQGAPPATTRRCQAAAVRPLTIGLGRCLKILVGLMTPVRRRRLPAILGLSHHW